MSHDPARRKQQQQDWGYSEAILVNNVIYVSGVVVGLKPDEHSLENAFSRALGEIKKRLERLGSGWGDVAEITSYHTDIVAQMPAMTAVKKRFISAPFPAWTAVGVTRLAPDTGIAEIRVVAYRGAIGANSTRPSRGPVKSCSESFKTAWDRQDVIAQPDPFGEC